MTAEKGVVHFRYVPTAPIAIAYFAMLGITLMLFLGRTEAAVRIDALPGLLPDFYQHVSNFSISYQLFSSIGFLWLLLGVGFRYILVLGAAVLVANIIYELYIPVLNIPDIIDAYYGMTGTLLAFALLILMRHGGLKPNITSTI